MDRSNDNDREAHVKRPLKEQGIFAAIAHRRFYSQMRWSFKSST
ncbi:hypothetical protein [Polycladomyces subterraneus]|uniref:Uncharacterized protein n=1 Tax=Polycladomyces subterraneus TaxID=1016997 RepID=A0ABT8IHW1_9BACL|nr:hypothetical protein [Polycladomyces subterraneus]MDN4592365.1 hypothetical protein [Polycladomyces subterraneus]